MGKRGPKPRKTIDTNWRSELAYAVGLLATDGCLSKDNLLIDLTSKDQEQLENFSKCLGIKFYIGSKLSSTNNECLRIQFKNRFFYDFLLSIGLTPVKSKTLGKIGIPRQFFFDFLRGCFDGDGCFYSYWDPRWKSSHMFYMTFASASRTHIEWIREEIHDHIGSGGHISKSQRKGSIYSLRYAKKESLDIINKMYYNPKVVCLTRKKNKIFEALETERVQQTNYS